MHKGFILLNCDLGAEEYIVDELKQMQDISNAYLTFGAYDVIAEIQTSNQDEFEKVIRELHSDRAKLNLLKSKNIEYVKDNAGATMKIMGKLKSLLPELN